MDIAWTLQPGCKVKTRLKSVRICKVRSVKVGLGWVFGTMKKIRKVIQHRIHIKFCDLIGSREN